LLRALEGCPGCQLGLWCVVPGLCAACTETMLFACLAEALPVCWINCAGTCRCFHEFAAGGIGVHVVVTTGECVEATQACVPANSPIHSSNPACTVTLRGLGVFDGIALPQMAAAPGTWWCRVWCCGPHHLAWMTMPVSLHIVGQQLSLCASQRCPTVVMHSHDAPGHVLYSSCQLCNACVRCNSPWVRPLSACLAALGEAPGCCPPCTIMYSLFMLFTRCLFAWCACARYAWVSVHSCHSVLLGLCTILPVVRFASVVWWLLSWGMAALEPFYLSCLVCVVHACVQRALHKCDFVHVQLRL